MSSTLPPNDDDRTLIGGAQRSGTATLSIDNKLPIGTKLGEFEITGLIGEGGFGIVYLAYDHSLEREIALKEYMPSALAARTSTLTVSVKSERYADTFQAGLKSFINEARLLAKFDHPSLVKVYRFWEANGTAYMVMPFYQGSTLKETLRHLGGPPDENWLKNLLRPLIDALALLHKEQCFHRDIAPDNILIVGDGRPVLLDFGAARRVIGDMTQALTVILKPGYAPIEQYADVPSMRQGAWTDVYALASVIYFAITGKPPLPSVARMMSDPLKPLTEQVADRYSLTFLSGVDKGLQLKPENRPQNITEFGSLLGIANRRERERTPQPTLAPQSVLAPTLEPPATVIPASPVVEKIKTGNRPWMPYAIASVVLVIVAAGWWMMSDTESERTAVAPIAKPSPAPQLLPPPAPTGKETSVPEAPTETPAAPEPVARFDPVESLDEVFRGRDRNHAVSVSVEKAHVRIGKDRFSFSIRSSKPGYVYLLMVGTNRSDFYQLFPNAIDSSNRIAANKPLSLPRKGWHLTAQGPPGTDHFVAIVSDRPRDFSSAGLKRLDPFSAFPLETAAQLHRSHRGDRPLFAGEALCEGQADCSQAYGATVFSVEEIDDASAAPTGSQPVIGQGDKSVIPEALPSKAKPAPQRAENKPQAKRAEVKEPSPRPKASPSAAEVQTPSSQKIQSGRCSELLLRASLGEALTSDELATLRKDCK